MEMEYGRPLPPELLVEMHKCLPLDNAIYVLVNVSKTFVLNNSTRMHRNIQRLKTSLNEYIGTFVGEERKNDREKLEITADVEWKPQLDALFRYGSWLTSTRLFSIDEILGGIITGTPKNFVEELLLYMANSRSVQTMIKYAKIYTELTMFPPYSTLPIPTFMKQLFEIDEDKKYVIGDRILIDSVELKTYDGQILHINEVIMGQNYHLVEVNEWQYELTLILVNKMDRKNWFRILICVDSSKEFIISIEFSKLNGKSIFRDSIEQNGNKLEAKYEYSWDNDFDFFLRRGAGFTPFRHFKLNHIGTEYDLYHIDYIDYLIGYIANTRHPEEFFESIDMNLEHKIRPYEFVTSLLIYDHILKVCYEDIPQGGIVTIFHKNKLHILSAKLVEPKKQWLELECAYDMEFTLANIPTNGEYLFDVDLQIGKQLDIIVGITIKKRKIDHIVEMMKCIEMGKKKKEINNLEDEEGPTYSGKIMNI